MIDFSFWVESISCFVFQACCLLLNLVEHSKFNRTMLRKTKVFDIMDGDNDDIFSCKVFSSENIYS